MTSYEYRVLKQKVAKILEGDNESISLDLKELFDLTEQLDNFLVHKLIVFAFSQGEKSGKQKLLAKINSL